MLFEFSDQSSKLANDVAKLLVAGAEQKNIADGDLRVVGMKQHAVAANVAIDRQPLVFRLPVRKDGDGEIHPRIFEADVFEEVLFLADAGKEIGDIEGPVYFFVSRELSPRGGDVAIAEMRRVLQRVMEDELGEADGFVKAVQPVVGLLAGA
ncbi:hypothetical protein RHSP_02300 [Rhizobium freirei PRF 81]|uniref:Uncharacterized protein n=1 Tax=Rhizobium freirei PRF 81 TaxID=363754 RepID=N6V5B8_9HYPH|nr:hypothetical protein RHSP_02300 [Rhizobium freirei PRF 81]